MIYSLPGNHRNNGEKLSSSTTEVKRQFVTNKIGVPMSQCGLLGEKRLRAVSRCGLLNETCVPVWLAA